MRKLTMLNILNKCLETASNQNATVQELRLICKELSELYWDLSTSAKEVDLAKKVVSALVRNPGMLTELLSLGQPYDLLFEYIADLNNNPAIKLILLEIPDLPILIAKIYKNKFYVTASECYPEWFESGLNYLKNSDRCCRCENLAVGKNADGYPLCHEHLKELEN